MNNLKVWPHLTLIAVVCAVVAGVGVGLWMKHERTASAEAIPNAARIQRVEGDVALSNSISNGDNNANDQWYAASENQPFSVGDRIYTRENSHASLAFTGRNFARLDPNTSLDVLALNDQRTQLALRDGSAMFDVGYLGSGDLFEVATPYGAVDFQQPGLYNVGFDNGQVLVSVLSGLAQVVGLGGSGQISKGEVLRLVGQTAADVVLSRLDGRDAGYLVDDYYAYQYPRYYDGRYRDYNAYLSDPYYFDPYRRYSSYQYANSYIPGLYDLDYYGDWRNLNGYGYAWSPRVDAGWMPYQSGYWYNDYPYGPTWVSSEPWGYAPYHYGRWAFVGDRWYWVPEQVNTAPVYSPALVAFVPFGQNDIGWVPLGPGDVYVPHYYNSDWQPYYLTRDGLYQRGVNLGVPGAVTVVPVDDFMRGGDWRRARRADANMLAHVNPVLDPLLFTPLRNAVIHSAWGRGKIAIPPGIAKKLQDTTVFTSSVPVAPPFRRDLARSLRVEPVSDRVKDQKLKVRDERGQGQADGEERGQGRGAPQAVAPPVAPPQVERGRGNPHAQVPQVEQRRGNPHAQNTQPQVASPRVERPKGNPHVSRPQVAEQPRPQQRIERAPQQRAPQQQVQRAPQPRVERAPAPRAERAARPAPQQAQGERVGRPVERPHAQPQPQQRVEKPQQQKQQGPPAAKPGGGAGKGGGGGKGKKP